MIEDGKTAVRSARTPTTGRCAAATAAAPTRGPRAEPVDGRLVCEKCFEKARRSGGSAGSPRDRGS